MALTLADLVATHADDGLVPAPVPPVAPGVDAPARPSFRTAAATTPAPRPARTNKYAANCVRCGARIAAEAGLLTRDANGKWAADHIGDCPPPPAPAAAPTAPATGAPRGGAWTEVPDGRYAVPSATGNNDLDFFLVSTAGEDEGEWAGMRRVERIIGGDRDAPVKGLARRAALEAIRDASYVTGAVEVTMPDGVTGTIPARDLTGPDAAAIRYADEFTRCGKCNRSLTDLTSRINGIGPVCITKD